MCVIMDTSTLCNILNQFEKFTEKPDKYLSLQDELAEKIKLLTKNLYDFTKIKDGVKQENSNTLNELIIDNLDEEQIWQQVELQNNTVCDNLVSDVAHLLAKKKKLTFPLAKKKKQKKALEESSNQKSDSKKTNNNEELEDEKEEKLETKNKVKNKKEPVKSSIVDDKFFKLHEMEKFLEKMEKEDDNDKKESDDEEIDYFEDDSSDSEDDSKERPHYNDFFDQPNDEADVTEKKRRKSDLDEEGEKQTKRVKFALNSDQEDEEEEDEDEDEVEEEDELDDINFDDIDEENEVEDNNDENDEEAEEESESDADENENKKETNKEPSTFEARQERLKSRISALEEEALREKPWQLKGEVTASNRPQNSLLQEYVEFDVATRPAPVLTEKSTLKLEDVIIQRIKDKAWDDVVRKIKPVESDIEYKKKLVLDQEKSKLSLAEIYEKEYLQQLESKNEDVLEKPEIEPPEHQEIRIMMNKLFSKLDALSNFHFTPKQITPEVKIISNVPAITMEEVAPIATSDATLLAPEEVKKKPKGNLIGKSERTATDKKRERRQKKLKQKLKYEKIEAKAKLKLEKSGGKDAQSKKISPKLLQKITKSSNVSQLEESGGGKYVKSSNAFFSKLQDETSSKINKKGFDLKRAKPGKKFGGKKSKGR